ncbi:aldose epimerase family protein [uncultured Kocuria sp.]|uniref:aldose epimerase family protein n=1 Tax=uncultured Kocuria sp. TaxID=259305 RepID=UPI00261388C0|nr:aldose epimerase family protein [uncultured Kocuria sp.]
MTVPAPRSFGTLPDGREVTVHTLTSPGGPVLRILDLGATVQALHLPDRAGGPGTNVVLGHPDAAGCAAPPEAFLGAVVGRHANRIAGARFDLDGRTVDLEPNEGGNSLHGGPDGFHRRTWQVVDAGPDRLVLELASPDGDQGFPGELTVRAAYTVTGDSVALDLEARTDAPTVVNPASHVYLNLAGEGAGTIEDHRLTVAADHYLPVDRDGLPTGGLVPVAGTPLDLTAPARLGERIRAEHPHLAAVGGIDHSFHLRGTGLRAAARVEHPASGRSVELWTDRPALQVYTGNALDGAITGTGGRAYRRGAGLALEPQCHPDSPNRPELSDPVLRPDGTYRSRTEWRFEC